MTAFRYGYTHPYNNLHSFQPPKSPSLLPKRRETADEIVMKLLFLASDAASNTTGTNIVMNGGSSPRAAPVNGN